MQDTLPFIRPLLVKYDRPGPRYSSYPTAPQFQAANAAMAFDASLIPHEERYSRTV